MQEKEMLNKKKLIDKYLKKKKYLCLFDAYFYNIDNLSFYIRLDYINKTRTYRITWFNLSAMTSNKVEDWINSSLVYPSLVESFKNIIASNGIVEDYKDADNIDSKVIISSHLKNYDYNKNSFEFNRYIPNCWSFLADALFILFDNLPKYIFPLFQILVEKIIKPSINSVFAFDLFNSDFDKLFDKEIISRGKNYYKEDRIIFLEKIGNVYNSVVRGSEDYLVTITNIDDTKEVQMTCTCPYDGFCKHIYATLLGIKNNREYKLFKIAYVDNNKSIIDNLKSFNYLLCVGIVDDFFVVIDNFNFTFLPILKNNKLTFKIIEDDKNKTLEKQLNKYLKVHKII